MPGPRVAANFGTARNPVLALIFGSVGDDTLVCLAHHLRHFEFWFDQGRHMGYSVTRMP
jgi:hypothetical protein